MKKLINYLLIIAALALGIFSFKYILKKNQESPEVIATTTPSIKPLDTPMVAGSGVIEPSSELIQISPQVSGVISEVLVKNNQEVKAGDLLFRLDIRDLKAQLKTRQAQLLKAQRNIDLSKTESADKKDKLDRYQGISDKRAITQEELLNRQFALENTQSRLEAAKAQWQESKALLDEIETAIALRDIKAPIDGTILQLKARVGQFAPANILSEALVTMGNIKPLHLRIDIDEADINRVDFKADAFAYTRGSQKKLNAKFVRAEPLVIPKKSLTNAINERVDTRVLQLIYELQPNEHVVYIGQQVDAFIPALVGELK
jgi:HlyD family secretion protein